MNDMNDDYLWDRTGEPDPEIQQLEEVLGRLRYQPKPLEIPAGVGPDRRRFSFTGAGSSFGPRLAIAATVAAIVLGLGLWVGLQRKGAVPEVAKTESPNNRTGTVQVAQTSQATKSNNDAASASNTSNQAVAPRTVLTSDSTDNPQRQRINSRPASQGLVATNRKRNRFPLNEDTELAGDELREAEAGKQQLMLALRVASSKLNFAQKKTQGTNFENQIHNQHKTG